MPSDAERHEILEFATKSVQQLSGAVGQVAESVNILGKVAEKGTIVFLLSFGSLMVIWSLFKIRLETNEFFLCVALGVTLILLGAGYDFCAYKWKVQDHIEKCRAQQEKDQLAAQIAQTGIRTVAALTQTVSTAAMTAAENVQKRAESEPFPDPQRRDR